MKNATAICTLTNQTCITAQKIEQLVIGVDAFEKINDKEKEDIYIGFVLDELEHLQRIALEMTSLISSELLGNSEEERKDDAEGSVFSEGDLTSVKGGKTKGKEKPKTQEKEA